MNYFVEGLQGSGKSTFVRRLSEKYHDYKAVCEGDYSPVELAWCAYVDKKTYAGILDKYSEVFSFSKYSRRHDVMDQIEKAL